MKKLWLCLVVSLCCFGIVTGCKKKDESVKTDSFHQDNQDSSEKDDSSADSDIEWNDAWGTGDAAISTTDKDTIDKNTSDDGTTNKNTTVEDSSEEDDNVLETPETEEDAVETPEKEEIIWTKPVIQP